MRPFFTALFRLPFTFTMFQRLWASQLRNKPDGDIQALHRATLKTWRIFRKQIRKGEPEMQWDSKTRIPWSFGMIVSSHSWNKWQTATTGCNRLSAESIAGRWQSLRKIKNEGRGTQNDVVENGNTHTKITKIRLLRRCTIKLKTSHDVLLHAPKLRAAKYGI